MTIPTVMKTVNDTHSRLGVTAKTKVNAKHLTFEEKVNKTNDCPAT